MFLRHGGAQHSRLAQRMPRLARDDAFDLVAFEVRLHVLGEDLAHGVAEHRMIVVIGDAVTGIEHGRRSDRESVWRQFSLFGPSRRGTG